MTKTLEIKPVTAATEQKFRITATKHHRRAPKKIKGVLTGNWKPTTVSKSELIEFLTTYTFHKIIGEPTKEAIDKAKNKAPAFCMAAFKNNIRKKDHVEQVFGFVFDYDDGTTIADFEAATKDCGLFYVLYETFTSSPELEKFRAVFPFADNVTFDAVSDWRSAHNGFAVELGIPLTFDPTCWQPERLFFNPSRPAGEDAGRTHVQDGVCVDPLGVKPVAVVRKDSSGKIIDAAVLEPLMLEVGGEEIDFRKHWNERNEIKLADLVEKHAPDYIRKPRPYGGFIIECPFDHEHGNAGKKDTATIVDNPNEKYHTATVSCLHGSCEHRDTADFVHGMIEHDWFEIDALGKTKDEQSTDWIKEHQASWMKTDFYTKTSKKDIGNLPNPDGLSDSEVMSAAIMAEVAECDKDTPAATIREKIIRPTVLAGTSDDLNDVKRLLSSIRGGQGKADLNKMVKEVRRDISSAAQKKKRAAAKSSSRPALPRGFDYAGGTFGMITKHNSDESELPFDVCRGVEFVGRARDYDSSSWVLVCEVKDADGIIKTVYIPAKHAGDDSSIKELREAGAIIYDSTGMKKVLVSVAPSKKCRLVHKGGWHQNEDGEDIFVLTGDEVEVFGDDSDEQIIYIQSGALKPKFNIGGTLADWKTHIATPVRGNNLLQFSLCVAFAAPLLKPMNVGGGGFHLVGESSIGKTVALKIFGSVFGGEEYVRSFRGTDNALESTCELHNDLGHAIDEISQADAASFGETVYMMANGEGKNRANNFGESKGTKTWTNMSLTSGESTVSEKIAENKFGVQIKGGQSVRLVDLFADAGRDMGIVESLNGADSSKVFVDALSTASHEYYGTAIRDFLTYITKEEMHASQELQDKRKQFIDAVVPADADGQIGRVADKFALCAVAGELAIEAGILPWKKGEAVSVSTLEFEKFLARRGGGKFEVLQGIAAVEKFLVVNASRFQNHTETEFQVSNKIGWFKDNGKTGVREYYIPCSNWSEVCGGYSPDKVAKALADKGELFKSSDGLTKSYRPKGLNPIKCRVLIQSGTSKKQLEEEKAQLLRDTIEKCYPLKDETEDMD